MVLYFGASLPIAQGAVTAVIFTFMGIYLLGLFIATLAEIDNPTFRLSKGLRTMYFIPTPRTSSRK